MSSSTLAPTKRNDEPLRQNSRLARGVRALSRGAHFAAPGRSERRTRVWNPGGTSAASAGGTVPNTQKPPCLSAKQRRRESLDSASNSLGRVGGDCGLILKRVEDALAVLQQEVLALDREKQQGANSVTTLAEGFGHIDRAIDAADRLREVTLSLRERLENSALLAPRSALAPRRIV